MKALLLILNMDPNQRQKLLNSASNAATPSPRSAVSASSVDGSSVDGFSVVGSPAPSENGGDFQRTHEKDAITCLATYICKNYLKSRDVWRYLYEGQKNMSNSKLRALLLRIKPVLTKKRQVLLQTQLDRNRNAFYRMIKRRVSSAKNYRAVTLAAGRKWQPGPLCDTIDLTHDDDSETDGEAGAKKTSKFKSEDSKSEEDEDDNSEEDDKPEEEETPKVVRRQLAKDFAERMSVRRRKKQIARKARGLPVNPPSSSKPVKRKASGTPDTKNKKIKAQSNKEKEEDKAQSNKEKEEEQEPMVPFKVGDKVSAKWTGKHQHGKWFPGSICSINVKARTMHVEFDDGDHDRKVKWSNIIIP